MSEENEKKEGLTSREYNQKNRDMEPQIEKLLEDVLELQNFRKNQEENTDNRHSYNMSALKNTEAILLAVQELEKESKATKEDMTRMDSAIGALLRIVKGDPENKHSKGHDDILAEHTSQLALINKILFTATFLATMTSFTIGILAASGILKEWIIN